MRKRAIFAVFVIGLLCAGSSTAQLITSKQYNGKTVTCMHSGLIGGDLKDCGVKAWWYTYVFIGRIMSIAPAAGGEKTLEIDPMEIFHGHPRSPLTVVTSQVGCLPRLSVGAHWLFYLRKEKRKPIVLDYFGNDSRPVGWVTEQIKTLRRLKELGNRGIVRGTVWQGNSLDSNPSAGATVIARGGPGNKLYFTSTNQNGDYEFLPLPAGSYKISVKPSGDFQLDSMNLDVSRGACWNLTMDSEPQGRISGFVRNADGTPVKVAEVMLVFPGNSVVPGRSVYEAAGVDKTGRFQFKDLGSGNYLVAVALSGRPAGHSVSINDLPPPNSLYYPDTYDPSKAKVIDLQKGQQVGNIDFTIPDQ